MKLTVINWTINSLLGLLGRVIEILFRIILLFLPLGIYLYLVQKRTKVSSTSNLSIYLDDKSVWQRVYPGFILVAQDKGQLNTWVTKIKNDIQNWISNNKYLLLLLFGTIIVGLMILDYMK